MCKEGGQEWWPRTQKDRLRLLFPRAGAQHAASLPRRAVSGSFVALIRERNGKGGFRGVTEGLLTYPLAHGDSESQGVWQRRLLHSCNQKAENRKKEMNELINMQDPLERGFLKRKLLMCGKVGAVHIRMTQ